MRQPGQLDGGLVIREVAAGLDDLLRFAAIAVATLYHYAFGPDAPYPFLCLPVLPGTFGGIELIADQRDCCG